MSDVRNDVRDWREAPARDHFLKSEI